MSEHIDINFSQPEALFQANTEVFERIQSAYPDSDRMLHTVHFDGSPFNKRKNLKLLEALGDYKDQVVDAAERMDMGRIASVEYLVNSMAVATERSQNEAGPHIDSVPGGIALITASVLPTVSFTRPQGLSDAEFNPYPYLMSVPLESVPGAYTFDRNLVDEAVRTGQLEQYRLQPGDVFSVDNRIHMADINKTGKVLPRIFIAAEVTFRD